MDLRILGLILTRLGNRRVGNGYETIDGVLEGRIGGFRREDAGDEGGDACGASSSRFLSVDTLNCNLG